MIPKLALAALSIVTLCAPGASAAAAEPADELLRVDDHRLHFEIRSGSRPVTVVLEAGGAADATSWETVPQRIAERTGATVVAYDRAGLGASELGPPGLLPADEVDQLAFALEHLRVPENTVIVCHSYGCLLALDFAGRHPERLLGLILVGPDEPAVHRRDGRIREIDGAEDRRPADQPRARHRAYDTDPRRSRRSCPGERAEGPAADGHPHGGSSVLGQRSDRCGLAT
jgi:pimeloyl-ACP methyl ester carboxylesterase